MKLNMRMTDWTLGALATGAAAVFLLLYFFPERRGIDAMRAEIQVKREFVRAAGETGAAISQIEAELATTNKYVKRWKARAASSAGMAAALGEIAQCVQRAGARTTRLAPQPAVDYQTLRRIPLSLECEGTFKEVWDVLSGLERSGRHMVISELKLQTSQEDGGPEHGGPEHGEIVHCALELGILAEISGKSDDVNLAGSR